MVHSYTLQTYGIGRLLEPKYANIHTNTVQTLYVCRLFKPKTVNIPPVPLGMSGYLWVRLGMSGYVWVHLGTLRNLMEPIGTLFCPDPNINRKKDQCSFAKGTKVENGGKSWTPILRNLEVPKDIWGPNITTFDLSYKSTNILEKFFWLVIGIR